MKNKKRALAYFIASILLVSVIAILSVTTFAEVVDPAANFIETIEILETTSDINDRETYLADATAYWQMYIDNGGTPSDTRVSESYKKYTTLKKEIELTIESCIKFTQFVENASNAYEYLSQKENLVNAEALLEKIDENYSGVSSSLEIYNLMIEKISNPERTCKLYIEKANTASDAKNYAEANKAVSDAKTLKNSINSFANNNFPGIDKYPGLKEADEKIETAKQYLTSCKLKAQPFIMAVENIYEAKTLSEGVIMAYNALEGIDQTTEGVEESLSKLKKIEIEYNNKVNSSNKTAEEVNKFIFAFLF